MFKQTEKYYKTQTLGFGFGSIYDYGCYLVSLTNGIVAKGHEYTPRTFNQRLKELDLFTGESQNYINVDQLAKRMPEVFTSFKSIEPWNDIEKLNKYLAEGYVVLGKVDARGIGGSGTHFVLIVDTDGENAIVFDPWFGDLIYVGERYGNIGNIKGLRIFGVKDINNGENPVENYKESEDDSMEVKDLLKKYGVKDINELDAKIFENNGINWGNEQKDGGHLGAARRKVRQLQIDMTSHVCPALTKDSADLELERTKKIFNGKGELVATEESYLPKEA